MKPALSDWLLTAERAAIHRPSATAVIADLHLGYAETRNRHGEAMPSADIDEVLQPLSALAAKYPVRRLIVAGDLFESVWNSDILDRFVDGVQSLNLELLAIVPGNHDRGLDSVDVGIAIHRDGYKLDGWTIVHGDGKLPLGPVVLGHFHPCLRLAGVAAPCFLVRENRVILPAFSEDAAGGNVLGQRVWRDHECHVIAGDRVLAFGPVGQLRSRLAARTKKKA